MKLVRGTESTHKAMLDAEESGRLHPSWSKGSRILMMPPTGLKEAKEFLQQIKAPTAAGFTPANMLANPGDASQRRK